ncbi:MAG TPA: M23 family metallopeptidase [Bacteroidales bacterium]|nr:M23 family metallopeptidase [Bacteroidales bacterium]
MKKKFSILLIFCAFGFWHSAFSQTTDSTIAIMYPLEIPMSVSGTFGELRTNALHAGIDFRTQSKTGFNVYAIDSGYVSRVKIESGGYGRAIYINHKNGLTSVYAHLEALSPAIDSFVKREQYRLMLFQVDLFPAKDSIRVSKGDVIGLSGNSGASTGPHLHFEIREEKEQIPLNFVRKFRFPIEDKEPPVIKSVWIYPLGDSTHVNLNDSVPYTYNLKQQDSIVNPNTPLRVWGKIGFGIDVYDPAKANNNKTGIYSIELMLDSKLIFSQVMDKFAFDQARYVNSLIDYNQFATDYTRINKLFVQPNNKLTIYPVTVSNGIATIKDTLTHQILIVVRDANLNRSALTLYIKGTRNTIAPKPKTMGYKKVLCMKEQVVEGKDIRVLFAENSLYEDLNLFLYTTPYKKGAYYSDLHQVHNKYVPIHQAVRLQIRPKNLPDSLKSKALLALIEKNKIYWCGGSYKGKYIEAYIRTFGQYAVIIDTVAPVIKPLNQGKKSNDYTKEDVIGFEITDDLSGISTYQGFIDGSWALFEYDAKNNYLYYKFDPTRITFGKKHIIDLYISDAKGNQRTYHSEFIK